MGVTKLTSSGRGEGFCNRVCGSDLHTMELCAGGHHQSDALRSRYPYAFDGLVKSPCGQFHCLNESPLSPLALTFNGSQVAT